MLQLLTQNLELQKSILLLLPTCIWIWQVISRRHLIAVYAGAFLAFVWEFQASLILIIILQTHEFLKFFPSSAIFYGVPIDIILGQAILFGPIIFLIFNTVSIYWKILCAGISMFILFRYSMLFDVQDKSAYGCTIILVLSIVPGLLLAEWTSRNKHLYVRSLLQSIAWAGLLLWLFPAMVLNATSTDWSILLNRALWVNILYLLPMCLPAWILFSALKQFAIEGRGTAFPYDPPKYLVHHGIYAYISNPMQVGICLMMGWWGIVLHNYLIILSAILAVWLFIIFKNICNGSCAIGENNPDWDRYQQEVPKWIPRTSPWKK